MYLDAGWSLVLLYISTNLNFTFIQIQCVPQKRLFFSKEISACCRKINLSYLDYFFEPKLAKPPLIFLK